MSRFKIVNDPVYGFIRIPYGLVFDLVEHPYFQRLRRIKQTSLSYLVYPGATHTLFHHALGALHLMTQAIATLREKSIEITDAEAEAAQAAILLHDIGHGPFSHTLEHTLLNIHHEELSLLFMEALNAEMDGRLTLTIDIFKGSYHKKFLHQLISSQLDVDRLDYLSRDSFYTGVSEGVIGYDRLIQMMTVHEGNLVLEEKGLYSLEKYLIARRLMYWQVYLHKTAISAEQMLIQAMRRARDLSRSGPTPPASEALQFFLANDIQLKDFQNSTSNLLEMYAALDDIDVAGAVKNWANHGDWTLGFLTKSLLNRKLFRSELKKTPFSSDYLEKVRLKVQKRLKYPQEHAKYLFIEGIETNTTYQVNNNEIKVLYKDGRCLPLSKGMPSDFLNRKITKHFLCYPKILD